MKISDKTDLSYQDGYFIVSQIHIPTEGKDKGKELLRNPKTYAMLGGAIKKLIEYKEDVMDIDNLAQQAMLEAGINKAVKGKSIKERNK